MKKVIIRHSVKNQSMMELLEERKLAIEILKENGYEIANNQCILFETLFNEQVVKNIPIFFMSERLKEISKCDAICFCGDWQKDIECTIEHDIAKLYNLKIIYIA